MRRPLLLLAAPCLLANGETPLPADSAVAIPAPIRAMLDAALASGNDGEVGTIVKYARAADPASGDAVLAIAEKWRADRAAARQQSIRDAGVFDLWSGRVELGGYVTTGNTDTKGGTAVIDAKREGLQWRHKFHVQADYQENRGVPVREHYLASYEPNYKVDDRLYAYGAAQYESDRFFGYDDRYAASVGVGYSALKTPAVRLDVELGPAYRHTAYTDERTENSAAARGSLALDWKLLPGLSVTQAAAAYVQRYNSTVSGTTALNAKLIGPLSAALSYNVQYESMPAAGAVTTDTTSRASLVYSF